VKTHLKRGLAALEQTLGDEREASAAEMIR
jgi:hypothetical protein